ncbi:MAG: 3'-5' exonuclease, partial [Spirochaetaceae bacterium]|nr:3'-5' exonuclease [Spirochaetaceae bacterium]
MTDYSGAPLWARFVNGGSQEKFGPPAAASAWQLPQGQERLPPPADAWPECPLPWDRESRDYIALDVETTGLDAVHDRIVEIGLVRFGFDKDGALLQKEEWSSLVNPGMQIPDSATSIHGITDLEVSAAPIFSDLAAEMAMIIRGKVFVAHNAPFDASFV